MIKLAQYRDNPLAPTALVSKVGGVYRLDHNLIRCTFIDEVPNAEGVIELVAQSHLVWKTEHHWLQSGEVFRWIKAEFVKGVFRNRGTLRGH